MSGPLADKQQKMDEQVANIKFSQVCKLKCHRKISLAQVVLSNIIALYLRGLLGLAGQPN